MSNTEQAFRAESASPAHTMKRWWGKYRFWLICSGAFITLSLLGYFLGTGSGQTAGALSITNPAPAGAQAAASVLRTQGVTVTAADSLAAATAALDANGPGTSTVLFYDPKNLLSSAQVASLSLRAEKAGAAIVAITPAPLAVKGLSAEISSSGTTAGTPTVAPQCTQPDAVAAGMIDGSAGNNGKGPLHLYKGVQTCFMPSGTAGTAGGYLAGNGTGSVVVLGNAGIISNQNLANRGNAALAFRLLGDSPNLIWYTASVKDIPVADQPPTLAEFTPEWIFPASAWLLLVAVLGMLWKGRRNGPLVAEPLPVIVKSSETLTGRARLYQDARAVETAIQTLRQAALTRLARTLRLGNAAPPAAVAEAAAAATGRKQLDVHALLLGAAPTSEKDMLSMAAELAALEEEVAQR
ncbi:DUF4350 domain-containing protein [Arthrobacter glacialis]|uniref:DUF4350 domain-containing protein n=1 Tax=Arthrobacter glacialis TaxID=1664 RepID=A0A2S3ZZG6_ARTGL|nr:DUF4350 domain-containing protein [Arthrobacter glacialis]POH58423.1 hypothetical protein CVS28_11575 [Arthrobacter glacialis]POH74640.1 hypothetical protein CVS27_05340 [Arthrobacter glacialis]